MFDQDQVEFKYQTYSKSALPMDSDTAYSKGILFEAYLGVAQRPVADMEPQTLEALSDHYNSQLSMQKTARDTTLRYAKAGRELSALSGVTTVCMSGLAYDIHGTPMNTDLGNAPEIVLVAGALAGAYLTASFMLAAKSKFRELARQDKRMKINTQNLQLVNDELNVSSYQL